MASPKKVIKKEDEDIVERDTPEPYVESGLYTGPKKIGDRPFIPRKENATPETIRKRKAVTQLTPGALKIHRAEGADRKAKWALENRLKKTVEYRKVPDSDKKAWLAYAWEKEAQKRYEKNISADNVYAEVKALADFEEDVAEKRLKETVEGWEETEVKAEDSDKEESDLLDESQMIMKKNVLPVFQKLERMAVYAGRYFLKNAGSEDPEGEMEKFLGDIVCKDFVKRPLEDVEAEFMAQKEEKLAMEKEKGEEAEVVAEEPESDDSEDELWEAVFEKEQLETESGSNESDGGEWAVNEEESEWEGFSDAE